MKLEEVVFVNERAAESMAPTPGCAMISINCPGHETTLKDGWDRVLRLQFHDVDRDMSSEGLTLFNKEHARQIIDFVDEIKDACHLLVVHCSAGISRSGAIATFVSEKFDIRMVPRHAPLHNRLVYSILYRMDHPGFEGIFK